MMMLHGTIPRLSVNDSRDVLQCNNLKFHVDRDYFYDKDGNEVEINCLTPCEFNRCVVFVSVGVDGVLCKQKGEWGFVQYFETSDNCGHYAPVFIRSFEMDEDRCIWLKLDWLKSDDDLALDATDPCDIRDYMLHEEWDLPLHSFRGAMRIQGKGRMCPYDMKSYTSSFDELRRWSKGRLHEDIGFLRDVGGDVTVANVDIYDAIEFYHISPYKIWRSRLGQFMWQTILAPSFLQLQNSEPNLDIAEELINCNKFKTSLLLKGPLTIADIHTASLVTNTSDVDDTSPRCCWCRGPNASVAVNYTRHEIVHAHQHCMRPMQLFVDVGNAMHDFRKHKQFLFQHLTSFLNTLVQSQTNTTHKRKM